MKKKTTTKVVPIHGRTGNKTTTLYGSYVPRAGCGDIGCAVATATVVPMAGHYRGVKKKASAAGRTLSIFYGHTPAYRPENRSREGFIVTTTKTPEKYMSDLRAEAERGHSPINEFVREVIQRGKQLELVEVDRVPENQKAEARNYYIHRFIEEGNKILNTRRRVPQQQTEAIPAPELAPGWEYVEQYKTQRFATVWERFRVASEQVVDCTIRSLSKLGLYLKYEQGVAGDTKQSGYMASSPWLN